MAKSSAARSPRSRMPKAGIQYAKGKDKTVLVRFMKRAFGKVKVKQLA